MGSRYILYFEPALANLNNMDNRMSNRLDSQIRDFLTAWQPKAAFAKKLQSHLWQFKWSPRQGSGARAFTGYFDGDDYDIALVWVTFKKKNERKFNAKQTQFDTRSKRLIEDVLTQKSADKIASWLTDQKENNSRKLLTENDV
ncbi:hypothetical protein [Halorussus ruber]|uniref:hypothetical protein n=1 Tax=Halorussus ruber TaxID=1126238 RepID=UPI00109305AF|nr:hypothetical protein [Halorussus ruber]